MRRAAAAIVGFGMMAACNLVTGVADLQVGGVEAQQVDILGDARPLLSHETIALGYAQLFRRAGQNEHADAAPHLDIAIVLETLISLGDGQRVGAMFGRERADRRQLVACTIFAPQDRRRDRAPQPDVDRAVVIAKCHAALIQQWAKESSQLPLPC